MTLTVSIVLHLLSAVVWVGGMFFAYMFLRPVAASQLEPPMRLQLWVGVFKKFFPFVWLSILFLPLTGYLMIFDLWGGMASTPLYVHIMNGLGIVMILIYLHVYFAPFKRLKEAVIKQDWPEGGRNLNIIRKMVGINTIIGLLVIVIVSAGRIF
ncbi:MAG: CopD family protein [Gammaproteobacteria bacterium]|nr:MAG: CopD family protein [Gammaproteobacteria bacterium]